MGENHTSLSGKILRALAVFVVTLLALLIFYEVYLRVWGDVETVEERRQQSMTYFFNGYTDVRPRPNQVIQTAKPTGEAFPIQLNDMGYRSVENIPPKAEGVTRIVVMGGSHVWDMFAENNQDWPHLMEVNLNENGHPEVEVINAGVPGYDTSHSLALLQFEVWMFEPDFVVVDHCWNDIKYFNLVTPSSSLVALSSNPERRQSRALYYMNPVDRLLGNSMVYQALREQFRLRFSPALKEGTPFRSERASSINELGVRQFELSLSAIVDFAQQIGAQPVLVIQPRLVHQDNSAEERETIAYELVGLSHEGLLEAFSRCEEVVRDVAAHEDIPVIDPSQEMTGNPVYFWDHVHTTDAGSQRLAEIVADGLAEVLPE